MNRRQVLLGGASLGVIVVGIVVTRGVPWSDGSEPTAEEPGAEDGSPEPPFEVRTIDAQGSEAGSVPIPDPGRLTLVNFTRTACPTSEGYLTNLAEARNRLGERDVDEGAVRFVSILERGRDPTDADEAFADWWAEHDGAWTLAIDDDGRVVAYYEGSYTPATVLVGGDGTIHWRHEGSPRASAIVAAIEDALEAEADGE